ncbi:MAG: ribonuclease P protein component [Alphaproteobacteria bacterium]
MLERLKTRKQFLRVAARQIKWAAPGVVLQVAPQPPEDRAELDAPRYGLTVSRRVGNAVVRNRARRRLRAAAEDVLARQAAPGNDYVLIGRQETPGREFAALKEDLETGLRRLGALLEPDDQSQDPPDRSRR